MNQTGDAPKPPRRGFSLRKLLWGGAILVVLVFVARSVFQSQGIGGPGGSTTGPTSVPGTTAPLPTATPQLTTPQGGPIFGGAGPIILMNPAVVHTGTAVTVSGYGFDPRARLDLVVSQQGAAGGQPIASVVADRSGTFTANFEMPQGMVGGPFVLQARERNSTKGAISNGSVAANAASVKMATMVGKVGDLVGWAGNGFAPGEAVNVYWNSLNGQPVATYQADDGGNLRATVRVPYAALGANSFIFVGAKSQSPVTATFLVLKLYPNVKPSSYAIQADNPVTFSGVGFGPNERVLVFLNNTNGPPIGTVQADAHGTFKNAGPLLIPYALKGKQKFVFIGEQSRAPTTVGFTVLPYFAQAQASVYGGLPGTTISFYATHFARNEVVHVYVGGGTGGGGTMVACFQTDGKGQAGAQGSYTIPGNAQTGKLVFRLVGNESGATAAAVVTVMPSAVPVQVPPQAPFTCPLDQPTQTPPATGAPATGAPGGGAAPGGQPPQPPAGGAPTGRIPRPAAAALLPLLVALPRGATARADRATSAVDGRGHRPLPGAGTARRGRARGPSFGAAFTAAGLIWLGLTVVLSVAMIVRLGLDRHGPDEPDADEPGAAAEARGRGGAPPPPAANAPPLVRRMVATRGVAPDGAAPTRLLAPAPEPAGPPLHAAPEAGWPLPVILASSEHAPRVAGTSDVGIAHRTEVNEDSLLMRVGTLRLDGTPEPYALVMVADGLGGCANGREASQLTTEVMADGVAASLADAHAAGAIAFADVLTWAATSANAALCARNDLQHTNMGAAVTAALLVRDVAHIVHIGHGRAYAYSPLRGLRQVTRDHTIVAGLVAAQLLPPVALYAHPRRRQVHRCLGRHEYNQVDAFRVVLEPEDRLLLCSNGLWEMVPDAQIESVLRIAADPGPAAQRLIAAANANGGQDNVSVVVARTLHDDVEAVP